MPRFVIAQNAFSSYNKLQKNTRKFPVDKIGKKLYNRKMDEKIRINKYLSDAGVCSRREADRMIEQARITVNGEKAVSGQKISLKDEICVDHVPVVKNEKKVLLLFNKPRGIVCSTKKQRQETTVTEYLDLSAENLSGGETGQRVPRDFFC